MAEIGERDRETIAQIARMMCVQRGLNPDTPVINGGTYAAPTEIKPTWEFWEKEATQIFQTFVAAAREEGRREERKRCAALCHEIAQLDKAESASDSAYRCRDLIRSGE